MVTSCACAANRHNMPLPVVVITGASTGIGAATATAFLSTGRYCVVLAARHQAEMEAVISEATKTYPNAAGRAQAVTADVTVRADVNHLAAESVRAFGRVDVWINNAGRGMWKKPSEVDDTDIDDMMSINVRSSLYGAQAALRQFRQQHATEATATYQIVNVSSIVGRLPHFNYMRSAYTASKHFLNGMTGALRAELAVSDPYIVVSTVSPGAVATDFGVHAHGPQSSNLFPNAQSSKEAADAIVRCVDTRAIDTYTKPELHDVVAKYYATLGLDPAVGPTTKTAP